MGKLTKVEVNRIKSGHAKQHDRKIHKTVYSHGIVLLPLYWITSLGAHFSPGLVDHDHSKGVKFAVF